MYQPPVLATGLAVFRGTFLPMAQRILVTRLLGRGQALLSFTMKTEPPRLDSSL